MLSRSVQGNSTKTCLACPPDCQIKNRYPTLKHVSLKVGATEECLEEELPFLDQMRFKLENSEVSGKNSLLSVIDFLLMYRSPCFLDYEAMEEENSIFSITIGSTPEVDIAETINNFDKVFLRFLLCFAHLM